MPSLFINIPPREKERSSSQKRDKLSAKGGSPDAEICQSPSWSEFGGSKTKKEKKRVEKEKKDLEKQLKKDEEKQKVAAKVGKRLSKKPPAAMDTQRMPTALRRFSSSSRSVSQPPSTDDSQRSSREERRSSISSISSFAKRFSPVSAKSFSAAPQNSRFMVSDTAPQLPKLSGIETHSRNVSTSTSEPTILDDGEEQSYQKDLIGFAYRLESLPIAKERNAEPSDRTSVPSSNSQHFVTPPTSRNNTDLDLPKVGHDTSMVPGSLRMGQRSSDDQGENGKQGRSRAGYQYPSWLRSQSEGYSKEGGKTTAFENHGQGNTVNGYGEPVSEASSGTPSAISPEISSSTDGSGYVHKQRMHQQQRSIASYEDEMALSDGLQLTDGYDSIYLDDQRWPPTPTDSAKSLQEPAETSSARQDKAEERKLTFEDEEEDQYHAFLKDTPHRSAEPAQPQSSRAPKTHKILGIQRRPKLEGPSVSADSTDTVRAGPANRNPYLPTSPPSPVSPGGAAVLSKGSKAEHEPKVATPNPLAMNPHRANPGVETSEGEARQDASNYSIPARSPRRPAHARPAASVLPRASTTPNLTSVHKLVLPKTGASASSTDTASDAPSSSDTHISPLKAEKSSVSELLGISSKKSTPEVIIEGIDGDGVIRETSIKRPRSNPQLQLPKSSLPSLDFLPQLKHQPLTKPKRLSPVTPPSSGSTTSADDRPTSYASMSKFPLSSSSASSLSNTSSLSPPTSTSSLPLTPKSSFHYSNPTVSSLLRPSSGPRRRTISPSSTQTPLNMIGAPGVGKDGNNGLDVKPIAKMFVICCKCKFWHDLPSKLYEAMAMGGRLIEETDRVAKSVGAKNGGKGKGKQETVQTMVRCPWCEHGMSTACCAGWTTVVYLHERHH